MSVSASKLLLGLSLAAYTYCSWEYLSLGKPAAVAPTKTRGLTSEMVNRAFSLNVSRDPFESTPLDRAVIAAHPAQKQNEKNLPEFTLQGVMISAGQRIAVVNGIAVQEGDLFESQPGGMTVQAKRIGIGYAVIDAGGRTVILRLEESSDLRKQITEGTASAKRLTKPTSDGGSTASVPVER